MPRHVRGSDYLSQATARRDALLVQLSEAEAQLRAAEETARDAGRPVLIAALERIKIASMDKAVARSIAYAIAKHGGRRVADHLTSIAGV